MSVRILSRQEPRHKRMPKYIQSGSEVSMSGEIGTVRWIAGAYARVLFKDNSELLTHYSWLRKPARSVAATAQDEDRNDYHED